MKTTTLALLVLAALARAQEVAPLSDTDGDGLPAAVEWALGLNPAAADTDGDAVPDGTEACAPGGNGREERILERGEGARLTAWRHDLRAWAFLVYRLSNHRGHTLRVYAPPIGQLPIEGLLQPCASGGDGTVTLYVEFPPEALGFLGGNLMFDGVVLGDQRHGVAGSLVGRVAPGWVLIEQDAQGRFRSMPAEVRAMNEFPVSGYLPGPRTCTQVSERMGPGGDFGYSRYMIVDEDCKPGGIECVFDCGVMIGYTFIWLTNPRR